MARSRPSAPRFGELLPSLAEHRKVVAFELQGHGRTADIDRPLGYEAMADDVVAAIERLGLERADIFGYSMGAFVALKIAISHPDRVRKLVFMSATYALSGVHPGLMDGLGEMTPEMMHGSPWHEEYMRIAPRPDDFATLFARKTAMDQEFHDLRSEDIEALEAPTLVILGDSDLARPEHAVEMFRLLGGGVFGDMPPGLPASQLAVLPGTSHVSIVSEPICCFRSSRRSSTLRCPRARSCDDRVRLSRRCGRIPCAAMSGIRMMRWNLRRSS